MTHTPTPLNPIAQWVAKHLSNSQQQPTQTTIDYQELARQVAHLLPAPQSPQKEDLPGFQERTFWNVCNIVGIILIPLVIAVLGLLYNQGAQTIASEQRRSDQFTALDQQRATVLKSCMDEMTELLLHEGLRESAAKAPVRIIARAKLLAGFSQLDGGRKGTLIRFLYEAQLLGVQPIVSLRGADLSGANLEGTPLNGIDLIATNLKGSNLRGAHLFGASLQASNMYQADLSGADLRYADLRGADLSGATLSKAKLDEADLSVSTLDGPQIFTNLKGARVTKDQLARTKKLKDALLPDGSRYPSSSYSVPHHQEPTN